MKMRESLLGARVISRPWLTRYDLRDKAVLVSGGSRGLGLAVARELLRYGARVALLARDEAELARARDHLRALPAMGRGTATSVITIRCDISEKAEVERAVVEAITELGAIDVLFNVAGTIEVGPIESMREADFERAMSANFWGAFHLMDAIVPGMRARGGGRIANVSSIGGVVAVPHLLPYVASKFALTGLSLGLRAELAKDGIGVITLCPGLMRTGSPVNATFKGDHQAEYAWFATADALPLLSTSAHAAARRMVRAVVRNEAMVHITLPAKLAGLAAGLSPGLVSGIMAIANRFLPRGNDPTGTSGQESRVEGGGWAPGAVDRAAARNNQNGKN
jgi:NAD(P)-dependent dehydrogenase (short-subunit alcohol dehydrogenase family)